MILEAPNGVQPLAGIGWAWGWTVFNEPAAPSDDSMVCGTVAINPLVVGTVEVNPLVRGRVQVSEC